MPINFSVAFDGQKFCVQENRSFGWKSDITHSGNYNTFAEAYNAALDKALDLQRYQSDVDIMDEQANKEKLLGSWGLNATQRTELEGKPSLSDLLTKAEKRSSSKSTSTKDTPHQTR